MSPFSDPMIDKIGKFFVVVRRTPHGEEYWHMKSFRWIAGREGKRRASRYSSTDAALKARQTVEECDEETDAEWQEELDEEIGTYVEVEMRKRHATD